MIMTATPGAAMTHADGGRPPRDGGSLTRRGTAGDARSSSIISRSDGPPPLTHVLAARTRVALGHLRKRDRSCAADI